MPTARHHPQFFAPNLPQWPFYQLQIDPTKWGYFSFVWTTREWLFLTRRLFQPTGPTNLSSLHPSRPCKIVQSRITLLLGQASHLASVVVVVAPSVAVGFQPRRLRRCRLLVSCWHSCFQTRLPDQTWQRQRPVFITSHEERNIGQYLRAQSTSIARRRERTNERRAERTNENEREKEKERKRARV